MGRYQQNNIVSEYENAAISGATDACPVSQLTLSVIAKIRSHTLIMWKADSLGHDKYVLAMAKKSVFEADSEIHLLLRTSCVLSREHAHRGPDSHQWRSTTAGSCSRTSRWA